MKRSTVRPTHTCCLAIAPLLVVLVPAAAFGAPFADVTPALLGDTAAWSHKVELADLDGNGRIDIVVANGGDYNAPGAPEMSFVLLQNDDDTFTDKGATIFGEPGLTRSIKARDLDGDGDLDLLVAGAWGTPSRLLLNDGAGGFTSTQGRLPDVSISAGDIELGDADNDGDLDVLVMDFGDGDPFEVKGRPRLWINDGAATFSDETDARFPTTRTGFSWDGEWADVDDDGDLDALVSCKVCSDGGIFLENQLVPSGDATFLDRSGLLPGDGNNYEFEAMDLDGDLDLDLVTINDGPDLKERVLRNELNEASGLFVDASDELLAGAANIGEDDNAAVFVDIDSDGDSDVLIGSLSGPDRLLKNDGSGVLNLAGELTDGAFTGGTLGIAVGDLDTDGRVDLVMCQGEVDVPEKIYFGTNEVPLDTAAPRIGTPRVLADGDVVVRVHDGRTPVKDHDFSAIFLSSRQGDVPLVWVGEMMWRATPPQGATRFAACATDAAGNAACGPALGEDPLEDRQGCASTSSASFLAICAVAALLKRNARACRKGPCGPFSARDGMQRNAENGGQAPDPQLFSEPRSRR
jgi:hypothetical protein